MAERTEASKQTSPGLVRHLGSWSMLATGLTGIIGSGWLFASLYAVQLAGPAAIVSWFIGCVMALALALVYAELGALIPAPGALARIPYVALGPFGAFLSGGLCWLAYVALVSIEVTAVIEYASNYLPRLTETRGKTRALSLEGVGVAALMIAFFTAINLAGVKWMARSNVAMTVWKVAVPVLVPLVLIFAGFRLENFTDYGGFAPYGVHGILGAVSSGGIMFSFIGFRAVIDLAGEAKNPARNVPLALVGSVVICLVIYLILQVALIGAMPADHLSNGWSGIIAYVGTGPFAALAVVLGLQWAAFLIYVDAVISPGGTALAYVGTSGRINYAMAQTGLFPSIFARLNRFRVPAWSMVINSAIGIFMLAPLPGWSQLASFISSSAVLSLAIGPVALIALRHQAPDYHRPFRIPYAMPFAALTFIFVGLIVYWSGWNTNWKVLLIVALGTVYFLVRELLSRGHPPSYFANGLWLVAYFAALAVVSWLGNFGGGLGVIPNGIDMLVIAVLSLAIFWMAVRLRLPSNVARARIDETQARQIEA